MLPSRPVVRVALPFLAALAVSSTACRDVEPRRGPVRPVDPPSFDEDSLPGRVLILGVGVGASEDDALSRAREDALAQAARTIRSRVEAESSQLTSLTAVSTGDDEERSEITSIASQIRVTSDESLRGAREHRRIDVSPQDGGGFRASLQLAFPREVVFPLERLQAIVADETRSAEERGRALLALADEYRAADDPDHAMLCARIATGTPSRPRALALIADWAEESRDLVAAISALERAGDMARVRWLREQLETPAAFVDRLRRTVREHAGARPFAVESMPRPASLEAKFVCPDAGHVTVIWIDADGPSVWRPRRAESPIWPAGPHSVRSKELVWKGDTTLLWLFTEAVFPEIGVDTNPETWAGADDLERLRILRRFDRAISEALSRSSTRATHREIQPASIR